MSAFLAAYYTFSPHVADLEREHPAVRDAIAALLAPLLHALSVATMADPESEASVAAHGAAALVLAAGMYVAAPAAGAWAAARAVSTDRRRNRAARARIGEQAGSGPRVPGARPDRVQAVRAQL